MAHGLNAAKDSFKHGLPACMPACQKRVPDLITDGCEPPCDWWELNSGPLEGWPVLLTSEPSLQPQNRLLQGTPMLPHISMYYVLCRGVSIDRVLKEDPYVAPVTLPVGWDPE